jgi:aarF domain-containing kinase
LQQPEWFTQNNPYIAWVKRLFPEFEFTWLGEEMRENLPKELNFVHEASNAAHLVSCFQDVKTSLYIPKVLFASKRVCIPHSHRRLRTTPYIRR